MKTKFTNAVGTPASGGFNSASRRIAAAGVRLLIGRTAAICVQGATPETTRETRVLPHIFPLRLLRERLCVKKLK